MVRHNCRVGSSCGLGRAAPKPTNAGLRAACMNRITSSLVFTRVARNGGSDFSGSAGACQSRALT